jgi:hypothetical protein
MTTSRPCRAAGRREPGGAGARARPAGHAPNWPRTAAAGVSSWDWRTDRRHAESGAVLLPRWSSPMRSTPTCPGDRHAPMREVAQNQQYFQQNRKNVTLLQPVTSCWWAPPAELRPSRWQLPGSRIAASTGPRAACTKNSGSLTDRDATQSPGTARPGPRRWHPGCICRPGRRLRLGRQFATGVVATDEATGPVRRSRRCTPATGWDASMSTQLSPVR